MNFIKLLKDEGYSLSDIETNVLNMYLEIYPEWAEVYNHITKVIPFEKFERIIDDIQHSDLKDFCHNVTQTTKKYFSVSGALNTHVFNSEKVLDSFLEKYNECKHCEFIFIIGHEIMIEKGENNLLEDFIRPYLGNRVSVYKYMVSERPEFHTQIRDDHFVTFEYPHTEFETLRMKFKFNNPEIAKFIEDFYLKKSKAIPVYDEFLENFFFKEISVFGGHSSDLEQYL